MHYVELGHEIWCLTSVWGKAGITRHLDPALAQHLHFVYVEMPDWMEYQYEHKRGIWVYIRYLSWQRRALRKARRLARQIDFDLVHHISWGSIQMGSSLWRLNKPFLFGPTGGGQHAPKTFKQYFLQHWETEIKRRKIGNLLYHFYPDFKQSQRKSHQNPRAE